MKRRKARRRTVELVRSSYQPTKAEREEEIRLDVPGNSDWDRFVSLTRAMVQPVEIEWVDRPERE